MKATGSYSFASKDRMFSSIGDTVFFNAPKHKFSLGFDHTVGQTGVTYGANFRWHQGFPAASSVYIGNVDDYSILDLRLNYRPPLLDALQITVDVNNVLGTKYQTFPGVPLIGRMGYLKLAYTFKN